MTYHVRCCSFNAFLIFCAYRNGKINGIHESDDNFAVTLKGSKDFLHTNGHIHHVNGALKPLDSGTCLKPTAQKQEFKSPQTDTSRTLKNNVSSSSFVTNCTTSTDSTAQPQSPKSITHNENIFHRATSTISTKTFSLERSVHQNTISQVRLNGSHHFVSDSILNDSGNTAGNSSHQSSDTGIISEFFSHSRLHHISTWRNEFSEYVNTLQSQRRAAGKTVFSGKEKIKKLSANKGKTIS